MRNDINIPIVLPVSKVEQPIGEFYVGRVDARTLTKISYTEIRAFVDGKQDKIAGIQRERSKKRIDEIKKYVNLDYATFPTSVIIAVAPECSRLVNFDPDMTPEQASAVFEEGDEQEIDDESKVFNLLLNSYGKKGGDDYIPAEKIAFIIDGQHRVAGLEGLDDDKEFDVNISVFVGASEADKAEIFARVNQAQTKVNQSLVVDLASYYEERGPVKFAHEVVLAMNQDEDGPLRDKVKRLGKADPGKGQIQTLAQATVVKPIVDYITADPEAERNKRYKGIFGSRRKPGEWRNYIFQPFYDEQDDGGMFLCLTNYFNAVKGRWPQVWDDAPAGTVLNRTTGYAALMKFMRPVYLHYCNEPGQILTRSDCEKVFAQIFIDAEDFNREEYLPGSSGAGKLYRQMMGYMGWKP
ncbi:DGQHR domain-containing protein [Sulfitobacter sp. M39]|uniref:DGQHR domain-containing protein n=1 Tax=Sulfitobacter sp. M39 TaxID=2675334 RepID=UPI001F3B56B3|nr:DGQHR domain-containing protein [Sulfitobacter sp. M39]